MTMDNIKYSVVFPFTFLFGDDRAMHLNLLEN
jgi:hypothetical protein